MAYQRPPGRAGGNLRPPTTPPIVESPADEALAEEEQRVAITLSVADGFKLGCGLILAGVAFYFALIIVVAAAFLVAIILGLPLPFGLAGRG